MDFEKVLESSCLTEKYLRDVVDRGVEDKVGRDRLLQFSDFCQNISPASREKEVILLNGVLSVLSDTDFLTEDRLTRLFTFVEQAGIRKDILVKGLTKVVKKLKGRSPILIALFYRFMAQNGLPPSFGEINKHRDIKRKYFWAWFDSAVEISSEFAFDEVLGKIKSDGDIDQFAIRIPYLYKNYSSSLSVDFFKNLARYIKGEKDRRKVENMYHLSTGMELNLDELSSPPELDNLKENISFYRSSSH